MMTMQTELLRIIQFNLLYPLFQPIIALDSSRILGYEALIRGPKGSPLSEPFALFSTATATHQLMELEFACLSVSCQKFVELQLEGKLFLNVSPECFISDDYRQRIIRHIVNTFALSPEQIVIELTESQPVDNLLLLSVASDHFKGLGFAVAIDDLGAGYAGLRVWGELCPDYVKIDRYFICGIDKDPVKREFVRAMLDIANRMGNKVIAEGIESADELNTLIALGLENVQGFYLARPEANPIKSYPNQLGGLSLGHRAIKQDVFRRTVGEIVVRVDVISSTELAESVVKRFRADLRLSCIPVVEGDRALGMVSRAELLNIFSRPFAHDLYAKKTIADFICPLTIMVDAASELKSVGQMITEDPLQDLSVDFIVTKNSTYLGVGKIRHLLRCITEEKLRAAKHSNPLTQLPGNVPLYERIDDFIQRKLPFVAAYVDINHFKPFNDAFGYSYGDEMILRLSKILTNSVNRDLDFVGHVGGDDFVVIFRSKNWHNICQTILNEFTQSYHDFVPRAQNEYWSTDRNGHRHSYGELTLAIGCVAPDLNSCLTHHHISVLLAEAKRSVKLMGGNAIFVSRRRHPSAA